MPTVLELIQAEKEAQDAEEARPPICDVESGRALITDGKPNPSVNITLEMCVFRIEEFEKMYRVELIDRDLEREGESLLKTFDGMDLARRAKFMFQLTIWKSHKSELNRLDFRRGFSYRFEKVHSLRLLYGNPAGSMQIRQPVRADPLPFPGLADDDRSHSLRSGSTGVSSCEDPPSTPTQNERDHVADGTANGAEGVASVVTPVSKAALKRKGSKEASAPAAPKKMRKGNGKTLCFDSPVQSTATEGEL